MDEYTKVNPSDDYTKVNPSDDYTKVNPSNDCIKLAFGNKARVGKDTLAIYVIENFYNVDTLRFADPIYQICDSIQRRLGKPVEKNPILLQTIGQTMKQIYGSDIWVDTLISKISGDRIVVPDLRFRNEKIALEQKGFKTIRVIRTDRVIDRPVNHPSEIDLDDAPFDYTIVNDYNIEHAYACLRGILSREFKIAPVQVIKKVTLFDNTDHIYGGFGNTLQEAIDQIDSSLAIAMADNH